MPTHASPSACPFLGRSAYAALKGPCPTTSALPQALAPAADRRRDDTAAPRLRRRGCRRGGPHRRPPQGAPHTRLRHARLQQLQALLPRLLPLARHQGRLPPPPRARRPGATPLTTKHSPRSSTGAARRPPRALQVFPLLPFTPSPSPLPSSDPSLAAA
ncbi:hypothetical protein PVAP13_4KG131205 [Panicum virgatum]|uniref:Uncharacterized protein n=1 Tax=Panicum virgatum TaxID=38727 RepID=A0A8T0TRB2_PANVG|nr:hypothetical protein PVAP13_4KG131205 [Panicum virgatum]